MSNERFSSFLTPVQEPPIGGTLKKHAGPPANPTAKKSKLDASPMAQKLARYLSVEFPFVDTHQGAQHNTIFRVVPAVVGPHQSLYGWSNYSDSGGKKWSSVH